MMILSSVSPMTVLWGVLILGVLGLIFGVALALAEKFLHVEEDHRIDDVEKMLPNANCGACGYAGCRQMAEALVKGEAKKVTQCKVGKKEKNFDQIIAYLTSNPDPDGTTHIPSL